jgi:transposase
MGRPSRLTDEQKLELRAAATEKIRDRSPFRRSTSELCTYAQREFGVSYGHRAMHKIMVSLGLEYLPHVNAWHPPRR